MLYDKLKDYAANGNYPMHMPGHKRSAEALPGGLPYDIDITEILGFDDLHDPRGVLLETARLAAKLYGSDKSFPLINGSTVGILAAIGANAKRGDRILIAGACHRSARNAVSLFGLTPAFIPPDIDEASGIDCSVTPGAVADALEGDGGIKLIVITSPTYEGVVSDVSAIAEVAHARGLPLIVDSAHGAHLGFSEAFPESAARAGADVAVMSLHKTLPALTQCSLLHVSGRFANVTETARLLSVLQTSSPSYVLMASIDACLRLLDAEKDRLFRGYERNLERFNADIWPLKNLFTLCHGSDGPHPGFFGFDPGKIVICTKNTAMSGMELADILRADHRIELELARAGHAIAMTSVCDSPEGFSRLANALLEIDSGL